MTSKDSGELPGSRPGGRLRLQPLALVAAAVGAVGSVGLQLYAGRHSPQHLVLLLIAGWVLSPFAALWSLHLASKRSPATFRAALHRTMLLVGVASFAIYSLAVLRPLVSQPPAFVFVAVPPVSLLVSAIILGTAWLRSRRPPHRSMAA